METIKRILDIINTNIILCLIPMIIIIWLIELVFKNRFETKRALNVIRWIVISYALLNLSYFLIGITLKPNEFAIVKRATGPYWWSYLLMTFGAVVLPFSLFYKRIGLKKRYLILVAFLIRSGRYFEIFVILVTSLHRDYLPSSFPTSKDETFILLFENIAIIFLQALILVVLILGLLKVYDKYISIFDTSRSPYSPKNSGRDDSSKLQ